MIESISLSQYFDTKFKKLGFNFIINRNNKKGKWNWWKVYEECFNLYWERFVNRGCASSNAKCMMYAADNKVGLYPTILIVEVEI